MKLDRRDSWIIFLFLSIVIIFFGQVLFTQATYVFRDFYHSVYPTRYFVSQCIKDGCFPLWNPYLYFGFPFFGSLQHGLLNPLSFFMYILPFDIGFKLFIVSHFYLSGIFMYLLMRDWKIGKIASLISAITYTFNGYILSIDTFSQLTSVCWTPLIFLFYNRAIITLKFRYVILTSISLAFQFLGDELTILYATVIVLNLFAMTKVFVEFRKKGEEKKKRIGYSLRIFLILPLVELLAIGLVSIQLFPFLETLTTSYRAERIVYSEAIKWSLQPLELLTLILPKKGGFVEFIFADLQMDLFKNLYFGIISFSLILVSFCERNRRNLFWMAIFLGSIILTFGDFLPFYKFLYNHFPFFSDASISGEIFLFNYFCRKYVSWFWI